MTQLPAHLQGRQSRNLAQTALDAVGIGRVPRLSIKGSRFTLVDAAGNQLPVPTLYIDIVVVDANPHKSKTFFGLNKAYDPEDPAPPICFSDNGIGPSVASREPQARTCAECPHDVWGSKISQIGNEVKQCSDHIKLGILVPSLSNQLFLFRVPPASFKAWQAYVQKLVNAHVELDTVLTRVGFEAGKVGILEFSAAGWVDEKTIAAVDEFAKLDTTARLLGKNDRPREKSLPAPATLAPALPEPPPPLPSAPVQPLPAAAEAPKRGRPRKPATEAASPAPVQAPFRESAPPPAADFGIVQNPPAPPAAFNLDELLK